MQPDPSWKVKFRLGRAAVLATLTPYEIESKAETDIAEREATAERRRARVAEALLVNQRLALGDTPDEVSSVLGITASSLRRRARRWGHALMQRKGFRRLSAWVSDRHVATLDRLAETWGVSREKALEELLRGVLDARAQRRVA